LASLSGNTNSFGLSAWWTPEESGWIPSISTGWGLTNVDDSNIAGVKSATSQSWYVGLEWDNAFLEGNSFGMAFGQPTFITDLDTKNGVDDTVDGAGYAWEFFYKFQVTDNITVTPAVHYLSKPFASQDSDGLNALSGLIKTTFKF
jgi:carbohydrate-selective porin OprB